MDVIEFCFSFSKKHMLREMKVVKKKKETFMILPSEALTFYFLLSFAMAILSDSASYGPSYLCVYKIDILNLTRARLSSQILHLLPIEIK